MKLRDLGWGTELEDIQANNYARLRSRKQEVYRAKMLTDEGTPLAVHPSTSV